MVSGLPECESPSRLYVFLGPLSPCPVLRKDQRKIKGKKRFFFKAIWTREEECKELIELAWDPYRDDSALPIQERLGGCQKNLQDWNKNRFGNIYKGLRQKQTRLQNLKSLNLLHDTAEEIQALKREINELHTREEIMWNQRSRIMWLQHGDKNTKFFHATTSQRRRKNKIGGLFDDTGIWHEDEETIEKIILDYFKSIFSSNQLSNFDESSNAMEERVSPEMNEELQREFRAEEVWMALKQMHPTKALGLDGMSPIIYRTYWDIFGPSITNCVLLALNSRIMPNEINKTYICLIPKTKNPPKDNRI